MNKQTESRIRSISCVRTVLFTVLIFFILPSSFAIGQPEINFTYSIVNPTEEPATSFGKSIAVIDDITGDTIPDVAVSAPELFLGEEKKGKVFTFSGDDGTLLETGFEDPLGSYYYFGTPLAVLDDVDGDMVRDVAVGDNYNEEVFIYSGANGQHLFELNQSGLVIDYLPPSLATLGDVSGDGISDIAVAYPQAADIPPYHSYDSGIVHVFSGSDGSHLYTLVHPDPTVDGIFFGQGLAGIDDVNDDSVPDIAVGACTSWDPCNGRVYLFSGADGTQIDYIDPTPPSSSLGGMVAVPDVNGDSVVDIAVVDDRKEVVVISVIDRAPLFRITDPNPGSTYESFGFSLTFVWDVNGDSIPDIAVGEPYQDVDNNPVQGQVHLFSGADGAHIVTLDDPIPQAGSYFGRYLASWGYGKFHAKSKGEPSVQFPLLAVVATRQVNEHTGMVFVFSKTIIPPVISSFTATPSIGGAPHTAFLFEVSASDQDGIISDYRWDFDGDGTTDMESTDPTISHSYAVAGIYTPTVTVVDDDGATDSQTTTVNVYSDDDGDGIADEVDMAPTTFSNYFDDGTTDGTITNRGGQILNIIDEPLNGVRISTNPSSASPPPSPATIQVCNDVMTLEFDGGDEVTVTCGSVIVKVIKQTVKLYFYINEKFASAALPADHELTFDPDTDFLTVPSSNPGPVIVSVDGKDISLEPGKSHISVDIDIKPGNEPNCFNNDGHGVIPVAILTTESFDASNVNPLTLLLDGMDARVKGKSNSAGSLEDVDGDGDLDLVVQIEDQDNIYSIGDSNATLTGNTFDGDSFEGTDSICIVQ